ncbi:hypothetical protein HanRHA438_Chr09g0413541 [Helianthus annuus]|nr:hypothetical protein HanIR_Chr09g0432801 [Helianthus annuus]KAJ0889501.1 hypothetical protein HanRHA438_Chr09g0413541 [Helianthus annuus]
MIKSSSFFCIFHPTCSANSCIFSFWSWVNFVRNLFFPDEFDPSDPIKLPVPGIEVY